MLVFKDTAPSGALPEDLVRNEIPMALRAPKETAACGSRIGGRPDVPAGFVWPEFETEICDGESARLPLSFLCQIRLCEVAAFDRDGVLPEKGLFQIADAVYDEIQSFGLKPKITVITDLLQSELYCQIHCAARICSGQPLTPDMLVVPFETDAVSRLCLAYKPDQETAARLRHLLSLIARQQEEKKQAQERG